jgi:peptide/nickel transport system substrate-binding protein/oligopeptide transport system substrate-binding protein
MNIRPRRALRRWIRPISIFVLLLAAAALLPAQTQADAFVINFLPTEVEYNPLTSYTTGEAQIFAGIYEGLVGYDPSSLDPIPALASRWEISEDGKRYRFFIRQNARYSNGDDITALDFRDTWLSLLEPDLDAPYASLLDIVAGVRDYRTGATTDPDDVGIRVISDKILEVELEERATHFLRILCHHSFVVVHPRTLRTNEFDDPTEIPVSGPYMVSAANDEEIILTENPEYWDRRRLDYGEIRIQFSDDYEAVTEAFNAGEIDWIRGGMDLSLVERRETIVINPLFATTYYQLSATQPPFNDPRVRRAFALLIPWEEIRSDEYWYLPATSLVPDLPAYPKAMGLSQNTDEALALLADAGYPEGRGLPTITISIPSPVESDVVAEAMLTSWESNLAVDVQAEVIPYPDYFDFVEDERFMVSTVSWIGDFADPLTFLDMWTTGSNLNNSGYSDQEYDEIIRRASGMTGDERYEELSRAEARLLADGVVLPISHSPSVNIINLGLVDGWFANPLDIHPLKYLGPRSGEPLRNVARGPAQTAPRDPEAGS